MDKVMFRYFPGISVVHRFDPRLKLPGCIFFCYALIRSTPAGLSLTAAALCTAFLLARIPVRTLLADFTGFLPLVLLLSAAVFLQNRSGGAAAIAGARFCLLILSGNLLVQTTDLCKLSSAVQWYLVPFPFLKGGRIAVMIGLSVGLIPLFFTELDESKQALASRGLTPRKRPLRWTVKLTGPLLIRLFLRTDDMATAMEARGYSNKKTFLPLKTRPSDWFQFTCILLVTLAALFLGSV